MAVQKSCDKIEDQHNYS